MESSRPVPAADSHTETRKTSVGDSDANTAFQIPHVDVGSNVEPQALVEVVIMRNVTVWFAERGARSRGQRFRHADVCRRRRRIGKTVPGSTPIRRAPTRKPRRDPEEGWSRAQASASRRRAAERRYDRIDRHHARAVRAAPRRRHRRDRLRGRLFSRCATSGQHRTGTAGSGGQPATAPGGHSHPAHRCVGLTEASTIPGSRQRCTMIRNRTPGCGSSLR